MISAKPRDFTGAKNWVFEKAVTRQYAPPIVQSPPYRVFSATSWRSGATGYYRAFITLKVLRDAYSVLDTTTGFDLGEDTKVWASAINKSEVLMLEREFDARILNAVSRFQKSNGPVIYDIDDHILGFSKIGKYHTYEEGFIRDFWNSENAENLKKCMDASDVIVATTKPLADLYGKQAGVKSVCIPNCIDSVSYRWNIDFDKKENRDYIIIGYMGGATHGADTELLVDTVNEILSKYSNVKFKFVGYAPQFVFDLIEKWTRKRILTDFGWTGLESYPLRMYDIDIGLAPLANNDFNRIGKSDLKYLEYTMAGACVVASSVGQYKESIVKNHNGLLAKDTNDWISNLSKLIENPDEITRLHRNAVEDVIVRRSVMETAKDWYKSIVSVRKRWEKRVVIP